MGADNKRYKDKKWLERKYWGEGKSERKIADECGVGRATIHRWLVRHGIERRDSSEWMEEKWGEKYRDEDWLREQYLDKERSPSEIADELECGQSTVYRWIRKHGIERRSQLEANVLAHSNHIELTEELTEFIEGLLLGDGCLHPKSSLSARYTHGDSFSEYLDWLKSRLEELGLECKIKDNHLRSKSYVELRGLYEKWYPDGKKKVPENLELTPAKLFNWWIGDGTYYEDGSVELSVLDLDKDVLVSKLEEVGVSCSTNKNGIHILAESRERFFESIFSTEYNIPPEYGYKFPERYWEPK